MEKTPKAVDKVYEETSRFVLIGLTGRTGSGCTTAANILRPEYLELPEKSDTFYAEDDQRKYKIIKKFIHEESALTHVPGRA
jgi:uridine kinase